MNSYNILVAEDNETMRLGIKETLLREGHKVYDFNNGVEAAEFADDKVDIAIIDLKMDPINGIETLERVKQKKNSIKTLMISAYGTIDEAVKAMQLGASDFLNKPFSPDELRLRIRSIAKEIEQENRIRILTEHKDLLEAEIYSGFDEIIGQSDVIKEVFSTIGKIASTDSAILISGESGTGKELVARAIYRKSVRNNKPFIKLNCGALNENLLESELFGHEKGSFTGAIKQKKGRFELANNGTLFLDEVGDLAQSTQVKLLRVLQENEFERVGGEQTIRTDVRIIAATNKDLKKLVNENIFREDLYYRLSVIPIELPSLRERKEDVPLLATHFLAKLAKRYKLRSKIIDEKGMNLLVNYSWPGNIRELENVIERLFVISPDVKLDNDLIARHLSDKSFTPVHGNGLSLDDSLYAYEKNLIMQAMKNADGVKNKAAKLLGIKTSTLYYKLEKFGLL